MIEMFLCSYFAGAATLFEDYARQNIRAKEVLFIPTAANVEEYRDYVDEAKEAFAKMGFTVQILDVSKASEAEAKAKIGAAQVLYVSGGNTFYLLQELKKKQLLSLIKEQIADGMIYVGESAGAIITAKDIDYNKIMDDKAVAKELNDTEALSEVDFYVLPHLGEEPFVESSQATLDTYSDQLNLLPLNNRQAVLMEDEEVKVLVENK